MSDAVTLPISDSSQVGEARRAASATARLLGFDDSQVGKVGIVATELANNLIKHARGGELLLRNLHNGAMSCIEILSLDRGPGMDLARCLQDGYSTSGSPGTGLGAVARLSTTFDVYSAPGHGSALLARMWARPDHVMSARHQADVGAFNLPKAMEMVCGDAWAVQPAAQASGGREPPVSRRQQFLVADGLGHGPLAAAAANEAVRIFRAHVGGEPVPLLDAIHSALRSTRGAAVAIADVDFAGHQVRYAGVGNISAAVFDGTQTRSMISHNGIIGHQIHKLQEFVYPFPEGALLIMHSDGLTGHWRFDQYPGLSRRTPSLIAGVLYRDFKRDRDDVTVLVARATDEANA